MLPSCLVALLLFVDLPSQIALSRIILYCAALLLLQGLVRDLCLLYIHKGAFSTVKQHAQCICLESSIGLLGIAIGGILLLSQFDIVVKLNTAIWGLLIAAVLMLGFVVKDLVFYWKSFQIRREKDHLNLIFRLSSNKAD